MTGQIRSKDSLKLKCQLARQCPFFNKYKSRKSIAWLGVFSSNCCSSHHTNCEIYIKYNKNGRFLHEDTMPTGAQVSAGFLALP